METEGKKTGRPSIETMAGCRAALASCLRAVRRNSLSTDTGRTLIAGYKALLEQLRWERETRYQRRIKVLWDAHQKAQGVVPQPDDEDGPGTH